jgi:hypothetical protein
MDLNPSWRPGQVTCHAPDCFAERPPSIDCWGARCNAGRFSRAERTFPAARDGVIVPFFGALGESWGFRSEKRGSGSRPRFSRIPCREPMSVWLIPDSHLLWERLLYRKKAVGGSVSVGPRLPRFIIGNTVIGRGLCKPDVSPKARRSNGCPPGNVHPLGRLARSANPGSG